MFLEEFKGFPAELNKKRKWLIFHFLRNIYFTSMIRRLLYNLGILESSLGEELEC